MDIANVYKLITTFEWTWKL